MASNDEVSEWTLFYHHFDPPFPGRAQAIRLMLVDAGVPFDETGDNLYGPEGFCDMFRGTGDNMKVFTKEGARKHNAPYPVMAPPLIWHRPKDGKEVFINQLPAIMRYVGTILGYCPTDPAEVALCDKILLDVCDYITEGRNSFHPVNGNASYSIQKEEGDRVSKEWTQRRMLIWLHSFEKMLEKRTSEEGYIVGEKVSYADIALYWLCEATQAQFDKEWYDFAWTKADTPLLKALKEKFDKRPNIAGWTGRFEYSGNSLM
jgi:glutathione S-transferase